MLEYKKRKKKQLANYSKMEQDINIGGVRRRRRKTNN
jgi:hypothetical protein